MVFRDIGCNELIKPMGNNTSDFGVVRFWSGTYLENEAFSVASNVILSKSSQAKVFTISFTQREG